MLAAGGRRETSVTTLRCWWSTRAIQPLSWPGAVMSRVGLGGTLQRLCGDDPEALDAIDRATAGRQGARTDLVDNVHEATRPDGNSSTAAIRRLRKDRPDLHARVLTGELSPHKAMREAVTPL